MRGRGVDSHEICLNTLGIHGLGRTSSHDQILLLNKSLLGSLSYELRSMSIRIRNLIRQLLEVEPPKDLLCPNFERI